MAIGTAAAIIGGSVLSGVAGARSAKKAAKVQAEAAQTGQEAQERAAQAGIEEQQRQFDITTQKLGSAGVQNRIQLERAQRQQQAQLDPFAQAGVSALEQQQALLGLGSPEQQAQAQQALTETPGQQFIRGRQEKALLRGAAAIGGLGGGNVRTALQQQATGFAQQDLANQFSRLQSLTGGGQQAASQIGQGQLQTGAGIGTGGINTAARQGQFGQAAAGNITNLLGQQGQAAQFGAQQVGAARAGGIQDQNQALQQTLGGVLTGAAQGGFLSAAQPQLAPGSAISPGSFARGSGLGQFNF